MSALRFGRHPSVRLLPCLRAVVRPRIGRHREKGPDGNKGNRSPRSSWRRSGASTRCSRSGAPSTAAARTSGMPCGRRSKPLLDDMYAWLLRERDTLSRSSEVLKPINLHAQALGRLRPLHLPRQDLPQQQRGRKSAAWHCSGKAQLDLRRFQRADFDVKPAAIPIKHRPPFRYEAGHHSNQRPAGFRH